MLAVRSNCLAAQFATPQHRAAMLPAPATGSRGLKGSCRASAAQRGQAAQGSAAPLGAAKLQGWSISGIVPANSSASSNAMWLHRAASKSSCTQWRAALARLKTLASSSSTLAEPSSTSSKDTEAAPYPWASDSSTGNGKVVRSTVRSSRNRMSASYKDLLFSPVPQPASTVEDTLDIESEGGTLPWFRESPPEPELQKAPASKKQVRALEFADDRELPMQGFLELRSQEDELIAASRQSVLPPLQSVLELTTAYKPPSKSLAATPETAEQTETATGTETVTPVGRSLPDGKGKLKDGTKWQKVSGEDLGENGYWKRWTLLNGSTADGQVQWEECWWEASDWHGLKELGATKTGNSAAGGAWKEAWTEKAYHDPDTLELTVERTAHKWARADGEAGDEWEEKWGETHKALGRVNKWADKWGKEGPNVWHEKWGEDYDGKGACQKWTDKWAERFVGDGARDQWGDKWTETFGHGKGEKHGEVWAIHANGHAYNRWWNEEHFGNGTVRKYGNSTSGEHWDAIEHMDTYYNPIPHFGFNLAVKHSPFLWRVPERPRRPIEDSAGEGDDVDLVGLGQGLSGLDAPWLEQGLAGRDSSGRAGSPASPARSSPSPVMSAPQANVLKTARAPEAQAPTTRTSLPMQRKQVGPSQSVSPPPSAPARQPMPASQQPASPLDDLSLGGGAQLDWSEVLRSSKARRPSKSPPPATPAPTSSTTRQPRVNRPPDQ